MTMTLSRADRRRMRRLAEQNDPTIEADRRFFERRPDRGFRVRRMSRSELAQLELACGAPLTPLAPGSAPFTVVKQLAPGVRLRIFVPGPEDEDGSNTSDAACAFIWDRYAETHPAVAEREAMFRQAMLGVGGPLRAGGDR